MGKKMKFLPSLLKNTEVKKSSSSWAWPSCHQPKTLSFRADNGKENTYLDSATTMQLLHITSQSFFTDHSVFTFSTINNNASAADADSDHEDHSTATKPLHHDDGGGNNDDDDSSIETVIRGLRSADRLFFEADETSSILESSSSSGKETNTLPAFKDSVVLSMDSQDPYVDFRKSMEEMVEAHGFKDWEVLEELLCWYLRVNGKSNHGYIVGAFVDLLVSLALASVSSTSTSSSSSSSYSPSSPLSFYSSSMSSSCSTRCVSCLEVEEEVNHNNDDDDANTPSSSSSLLELVKEDIQIQDQPSSSSSN